jgi:hypothetical protein
MSQQPDADEEFLEALRRGLHESVAFWSPEKKLERETYTVRTLLRHLGVQYAEAEITPEPSEPPDMKFRDARFEIKEILDHDRRRHDEYRKKLAKALTAKSPRELMEQYTPQDLTFQKIGDRVVQILRDAATHYAPKVIEQLDLLVYVNLLKRIVVLDSQVPASSHFSQFGWRSISVVRSSVACVLYARADAPDFLRSHLGKPMSRPGEE